MSDMAPLIAVTETTSPSGNVQTPQPNVNLDSSAPSAFAAPVHAQAGELEASLSASEHGEGLLPQDALREDGADRGVFQDAWQAVSHWFNDARTEGSSALHGMCVILYLC